MGYRRTSWSVRSYQHPPKLCLPFSPHPDLRRSDFCLEQVNVCVCVGREVRNDPWRNHNGLVIWDDKPLKACCGGPSAPSSVVATRPHPPRRLKQVRGTNTYLTYQVRNCKSTRPGVLYLQQLLIFAYVDHLGNLYNHTKHTRRHLDRVTKAELVYVCSTFGKQCWKRTSRTRWP